MGFSFREWVLSLEVIYFLSRPPIMKQAHKNDMKINWCKKYSIYILKVTT